MDLQLYLKTVESQISDGRNGKGSKVETDICNLVTNCIEENKATTIKYIAETLNKSTQQIHQTIKKASTVKKVKHNGRTLIVLSDMV